MDDDWDNDDGGQVKTGSAFDRKEYSFAEPRSDFKNHRSREQNSSSDRNRGRSGSNRSREENGSSQTFEIQGNQIGAFIGKGGSNIRNYEEKFNVKLNLDKSSNTVTVSGDPSSISEACEFIQQDLNSRPPRREQDFGSRNGGGGGG